MQAVPGREGPDCLVGETLVTTSGGLVSLELLRKMACAGDELPEVLSFNRRIQRWVLRQINGVWVAGRTDRLLEVRIEGDRALRCTPQHSFLTHEVGWAQARELRPGVSLLGIARSRVEEVERVDLAAPVAVFDLEVEGTRNFAVTNDGSRGAHPVVVHNSHAPARSLTPPSH